MAKGKKKAEEVVEVSKEAILKGVLGDLVKRYGRGVVRNADDPKSMDEKRAVLNNISTGSINFDKLFGVGGCPWGKILEVRGKPQQFKTGLLICLAANAQKQGFLVVFIDYEHRFDPDRARQLGLDVDDSTKFLLLDPDTGEQGLSAAEAILKSIEKVMTIIDSVSAMLPESDLKKLIDGGQGQMGSQAKLIANALKRLAGAVAKKKSILAFTNQYRTAMSGIFTYRGVSGGQSLPYYNSYIMEIKWDKKKEIVDNENRQIGQNIEIVMVKNSTDFPRRSRFVPVHLGFGIWKSYEIFELGREHGVIEKRGGYYFPAYFNDIGDIELNEDGEIRFEEKGIQGKDAFLAYLEENVDTMKNFDDFLRKNLGIFNWEKVAQDKKKTVKEKIKNNVAKSSVKKEKAAKVLMDGAEELSAVAKKIEEDLDSIEKEGE